MLKKLQKTDEDTIALIKEVSKYLFSIGIRTSEERAWDIVQEIYKIPYKMLVERNPEITKWTEDGKYAARTSGKHQLSIRGLGKFTLQAVGKGKNKDNNSARVKFAPSKDIQNILDEKVKVVK